MSHVYNGFEKDVVLTRFGLGSKVHPFPKNRCSDGLDYLVLPLEIQETLYSAKTMMGATPQALYIGELGNDFLKFW